MMKKTFLFVVIISFIWFISTFFYSYYKSKILNDMILVHNNILLLKEQVFEINKGVEDFFYEISKEAGKETIIYNIKPPFIEKSENIITSLNYNINKYGCSQCHSLNDAFIKRLSIRKEELTKNLTQFKDTLALYYKSTATKAQLLSAKRTFLEVIFSIKDDMDKMEHNLQNILIKKITFHQRIELLINFISLILISLLAWFFYKKILKNILLLKRLSKKIENNQSLSDIDIDQFSSRELKEISRTLIDSFQRLISTEKQLKMHIEEMESMNEELQSSNQQLEMVTAELEEIKSNLEKKVQEKTRDLEETYRELERSEAIKSSFLQSISHEFKTPLTPLFGYLKLMKNKELGELTPLQEQSLSIMLTCAEKIYNTVDDLILLTKLDVDSENFLFRDVDLNIIVKTVISRVEKELDEKRIKIQVSLPEIPIIIKGEQLILIQTILHILRNAIKYTNEGIISVSLSQEDNQAVLRIKDTGQGIPEKVLKEINDFFNAKNVFTIKRGDAITVGLNILKKVSILHNCKVNYKSERGKGTTVELFFPIKA